LGPWCHAQYLYEVEKVDPDAPQHVADFNLVKVNLAGETMEGQADMPRDECPKTIDQGTEAAIKHEAASKAAFMQTLDWLRFRLPFTGNRPQDLVL
jgi:hypothetical protein